MQLLNHYDGYLCNALLDCYPNIGLLLKFFKSNSLIRFHHVYIYKGNPWSDRKDRKQYFGEVARSRGFDPLVAENWYSVSYDQLLRVQVMHN